MRTRLPVANLRRQRLVKAIKCLTMAGQGQPQLVKGWPRPPNAVATRHRLTTPDVNKLIVMQHNTQTYSSSSLTEASLAAE
jgi:hypothetical protein